ncbi:hypothetical protein K388_00617 [Streptomyces sp. KhCrAH-43]|uniref:hypothetical protein n=1 Tax=unclassified Streptomyces TaxID=2593676 RepID=UPI000DC21F40|nr:MULTISPECIES: hypothetical protein [unclassified Streptomyces]RAJ67874.1 hypothetical protein K388_00617 [Streptomyces sp. KhCrAH-43]
MKRIRVHIAGAAAIAAAALVCVGGCSAPDGGSADAKPAGSPRAGSEADLAVAREPKACRGGTYTWFNLEKRSVLNGLTDPQCVEGKPGEPVKMTEPMRRLRTDRASLETQGPRLDPQEVLFALSVHIGFADKGDDPGDGSGLGEPGEYAPVEGGGGEISGMNGAVLVDFSSLQLVETDFRYTCGSGERRERTTGHVVTWTYSSTGELRCGVPLPRDASAAAHEAVRLSCPR